MKLAKLFKTWSEEGMRLPMAYSNETKAGSITVFFTWLAGISTTFSVFLLNFYEKALSATIAAMCFFSICMVFLRMRRIDKFKIDLDDRTIELDAEDEE